MWYLVVESAIHHSLDLSRLRWYNGFVLNGDAAPRTLGSVSSAGDFNGDGIDDLIIGQSRTAFNGDRRAGESYLVFGQRQALPAFSIFYLRWQ